MSEGLLPAGGWQSLGQAQLDGGAEHGLCSVPWFGGQFLPCHRGRWELGPIPSLGCLASHPSEALDRNQGPPISSAQDCPLYLWSQCPSRHGILLTTALREASLHSPGTPGRLGGSGKVSLMDSQTGKHFLLTDPEIGK